MPKCQCRTKHCKLWGKLRISDYTFYQHSGIHSACPLLMVHVHVHGACPISWYMSMFMSIVHVHVLGTCPSPCCVSMSMLEVHVHYCMTMVYAMFTLHSHVHASSQCQCCVYICPCPCCMPMYISMLLARVHAVFPYSCCRSISCCMSKSNCVSIVHSACQRP